MKNSCKVIIGLALIAAGVIWILSILGVLSFAFSTEGWWALFVIVPSLIGLLSGHDKVGSLIGIGVGVLLLLAARDVITWQMMWQIALALIIIGFGVNFLVNKSWCHHPEVCECKNISREGRNIRIIENAFGRRDMSFAGEKFEGADVDSSFGALSLDLRGAEIADGAVIKLNVGFSGTSIIVPEDLAVNISVNSGFGGVSDNRRNKVSSGTPTLVITGSVGFGGVEIRN